MLNKNVINKGLMDGKKDCEKMIKDLEMENKIYRVGK
jgi:myosin protein heavy chain